MECNSFFSEQYELLRNVLRLLFSTIRYVFSEQYELLRNVLRLLFSTIRYVSMFSTAE